MFVKKNDITLRLKLLTQCLNFFQDEANSQAFIRFPKGVHSDLKLKAILRKYRQLPGIASVR
jgi:hypothetical protein